MQAFLDLLDKGGPVMYPLILCSIVALAIVIEKLYNLSQAQVDTDELIGIIKENVTRRDFQQAIGICEATPGPVARTLSAALSLRGQDTEAVRQGVHEAALKETPRMERFMSALSTIVTVAPMLGLLGTITGLMSIFRVIAGGQIGHAEELSAGIAEALITTAVGLAIAIIFMAFYNYLATRIDALVNDMEKATAELLNFLRMEKGKHGADFQKTAAGEAVD